MLKNIIIASALIIGAGFGIRHTMNDLQAEAAFISSYQLVGCGSDFHDEGCVIRDGQHNLIWTNSWFTDDADLQRTVRGLRYSATQNEINAELGGDLYMFHLEALRYEPGFNVEVFAGIISGNVEDHIIADDGSGVVTAYWKNY